jgi:hypothetical protein
MSTLTDFARRRLRPAVRRDRIVGALALGMALLVLAACGASPPPEPGLSRGVPPDLRGRRVILLPVQLVVGVAGDPDAELAFTLTDVGNEVDWVREEEIQDAMRRSPTVQTRTRGLPVSPFLQAEVDRVGDPLYGFLRRMEALVDADAILLPVAATYEPNEAIPDSGPRVRITATLIEPRTGRVMWFGIEEGDEFDTTDPRALASAVENLSHTLFWYMGG